MSIQAKGTARFLASREDITEACRHMYGKDPRGIDYKTKIDEHMGEDATWRFVRIDVTEAWCFDSREFGEERVQIDLPSLSIPLDY